jgi:hypothetical protein
MFGLEQCSRRYSTPSSLRGAKLCLNDMNRTHSLKFRKVEGIKTARTHLPDYDSRGSYHLIGEEDQPSSTPLFFSHSKVLKRSTTRAPKTPQQNGMMVESSRQRQKEEADEGEVK